MNTATQIASPKPRKRCAVYCRVSSDERLEQEFNSIDAQKEAGQSYVASQRSEGWIPVVDDYDDPGFSGGNTERPGLKRLMADIERGLVDIVVVYKIDRLTRNLADFSKMVEVFERQSVSFVSVTQQFNTTTSMGRLMLNVLLSFAQFEREVTGERIRDKIAASKRKGMWMGGMPPLGYDVQNRQLVVNPAEAAVVQRIFKDMAVIGSPLKIAGQLAAQGITTKAWKTSTGKVRLGTRIDKQYMYKMLRNRIYLGEMSHKGTWYPGTQAPIIDIDLWNSVHAVLGKDIHARSNQTKMAARTDILLRGLLYAPNGERMYSTYTRKNDKKYRYYVTKSEARFGSDSRSHERIPVETVDVPVVAQIKTVLASPEAIASVCAAIDHSQATCINESDVVLSMTRLGNVWEQLYPAEQRRIVNLMIERIDLVSEGLKIKWRELGWKGLIGEFAPKSIGSELIEVEETPTSALS